MCSERYGWTLDQRRKPKVTNPNVHLFVEQNVLALKIPMHNSAGVAVRNCSDNLPEHLLGLVFINVTVLVDIFQKIAVGSILHHHVESVCVINLIQQLDLIRVGGRRRREDAAQRQQQASDVLLHRGRVCI